MSEDGLRIGLAGFGTVGRELARRLDAGDIPGVRLVAISARDLAKARANAGELATMPEVVAVPELPGLVDVVVECATGEALPEIARAALEAGKTLIPVSVGAIAANPEILDLAERHGGLLKLATGALPGLDGIRGARECGLHSVKLTSRILPHSLAHESYIQERGFDLSEPLEAAVKVFEGSARQAAAAFPRHFNVAVALSLAGLGFDETEVEIWADAEIQGAVHHVAVRSEAFELELISRNRPSATNPSTSRAVAPSVMAALRGLAGSVQVGS